MLKVLTQESSFHTPKQFSLKAKHYLYHQGDPHAQIYILLQGWVLLTQESEQGNRQIIRSVLPGDPIGIQPNLHGPYQYSAIALQDCIICIAPDFFTLCSHHPELALKLAWIEACVCTLTEIYMTNIAQRNALEKVAFMMLELFQRLKVRGLNKGNTVPFPLTQEEIADSLGLTAVHVNRTLQKLEHQKLLRLQRHELTILDYEKLNSLVGLELKSLESCDFLCDDC